VHCLIIDDNEMAAQELEAILKTLPRCFSVRIASEGAEVTRYFSMHLVDTVFVRIRLFDFRWFEKLMIQPALVLIVNRQANDKVDYYSEDDHLLIEPFSLFHLRRLFKKIAQLPKHPRPDFLFIRDGKRWVKIEMDQIERVEKKVNYAEVFTKTGSILFRGSVSQFRRYLPMDRFVDVSETNIKNNKYG
jgi:DNA-binding LytR/AlgR family response regulator